MQVPNCERVFSLEKQAVAFIGRSTRPRSVVLSLKSTLLRNQARKKGKPGGLAFLFCRCVRWGWGKIEEERGESGSNPNNRPRQMPLGPMIQRGEESGPQIFKVAR